MINDNSVVLDAFSDNENVLADHSVLSHTFNGVTFHVANAAMIDANVTDAKALPKSLDVFKGETPEEKLETLETQGEAVTAAIIDVAYEMLLSGSEPTKPDIKNPDNYTEKVSEFAKELLEHLTSQTDNISPIRDFVNKIFYCVIYDYLEKIYNNPKDITDKKEEVISTILKKTNNGTTKHYYLFSALGDFFENNQPTGGFVLPGDDKPYMKETRYEFFSNKVKDENNVLVLSEAFVANQTSSLIQKPDKSQFMTGKYVTQDTKDDKHGVLVHADMENAEIKDMTKTFNEKKHTGDFTLVTVNNINVLNWHSISDGITYNNFKTLLDYVIDNHPEINLMMGDSNITKEKQKSKLKVDQAQIKKYDDDYTSKSMIGKFIERYNEENDERPELTFVVPENKIKKSRYLGNIILNNQLHKADDEGYDGMFIIEFKKPEATETEAPETEATQKEEPKIDLGSRLKEESSTNGAPAYINNSSAAGGGRRRSRRGRGKRAIRRTRKGNRSKKGLGRVRISRRGRGRAKRTLIPKRR